MNLLPENKLIWSAVVANSRMNRERNASGINSYEQEFRFKPEEFLHKKFVESGEASWLDICCGYGKALLQTAEYFNKMGINKKIRLTGIDLIDGFLTPDSSITFLNFEAKSILDYQTQQKYDLVTCVHGLHYIGDKLRAIEIAVNALVPNGLFIANLDLDNIVINGFSAKAVLKNLLKEKGLIYNSNLKHIKRIDSNHIHFDIQYLGADNGHGPNYTGQESVTSHYLL